MQIMAQQNREENLRKKKKMISCFFFNYRLTPGPIFAPQPAVSNCVLMLPSVQLMDGVYTGLPAPVRDGHSPFVPTVHGWTSCGMFSQLVMVMKILEAWLHDDPKIRDGDHVNEPGYFHHRLNESGNFIRAQHKAGATLMYRQPGQCVNTCCWCAVPRYMTMYYCAGMLQQKPYAPVHLEPTGLPSIMCPDYKRFALCGKVILC
jgi:hypothetical protein